MRGLGIGSFKLPELFGTAGAVSTTVGAGADCTAATCACDDARTSGGVRCSGSCTERLGGTAGCAAGSGSIGCTSGDGEGAEGASSIQLARKIIGSSLCRMGSDRRENVAAPTACRHTTKASRNPRAASGTESFTRSFTARMGKQASIARFKFNANPVTPCAGGTFPHGVKRPERLDKHANPLRSQNPLLVLG